MATSVYRVNKGVNKCIEFKGFKAQYIWYLGGGYVVLMICFAIMYLTGLNAHISLVLVLAAGFAWFSWIYKLSNTYGEYGMMKRAAQRLLPTVIRCNSRKLFFKK